MFCNIDLSAMLLSLGKPMGQVDGTFIPLCLIPMPCVPRLQEPAALPYGDASYQDSKQAEDDVGNGVSGWRRMIVGCAGCSVDTGRHNVDHGWDFRSLRA